MNYGKTLEKINLPRFSAVVFFIFAFFDRSSLTAGLMRSGCRRKVATKAKNKKTGEGFATSHFYFFFLRFDLIASI